MNLTKEECEKVLDVITNMSAAIQYLASAPVCCCSIGEHEKNVIHQLIEEHFDKDNSKRRMIYD